VPAPFRSQALVCRDAVEAVTDYLEGAMSPRQRERFESHLDECDHCREYLEQMRTMIHALGRVEPEALGPPVMDELVLLYQRWRAGG
jgi:predicted anti-sigma-YlaC factor YlaD